MIEYRKGCLIQALKDDKIDILAHGVNCQGVMGSGVAKLVKENFPDAYEAYKLKGLSYAYGGKNLLGSAGLVQLNSGQFIANLFTQDRYGKDGKQYVDYAAVSSCFNQLLSRFTWFHIGIPKIGAGLGGGNWDIIEKLIEDQVVKTKYQGNLVVYCLD
jgi:O-acetyl-ADP-ribose deacetylase (regulator of RNase III)